MDEVEAERLRLVAELDADSEDAGWRERSEAGTFGCHEALHTASLLMDSVGRHLLNHEAVILRPEWFALAERAHRALFDLYQMIDADHLGGPSEGD